MRAVTLLPLVVFAQLVAEPTPPPTAAPVCIGCRADVDDVQSSYSATAWAALERGEVVTSKIDAPHEQSDPAVRSNIEASAIVPYPPRQVWSVVTDFESRPRYVPGAKDVHILRTDGNRLWVAEHLRILLINVRFVVITTLEPETGSVTWTMDQSVDHDIADTSGAWKVVPLRGGTETLIRYRASIDSGRAVPGFVENFLTRRSLPKIVEGVRSEVQRRFPLLRAPVDEAAKS